jgi:ABC-type transport system involved in multi-copper enzyme maturation permease subunit
MLSLRAVRRGTLVICVIGIAGMIVSSALTHNGAAVTFGIITAVAIVCSMVATSVAASTRGRPPEDVEAPPDALAAIVEQQVVALVEAGADEEAVRQLVGEAVRLGRTLAHSTPRP